MTQFFLDTEEQHIEFTKSVLFTDPEPILAQGKQEPLLPRKKRFAENADFYFEDITGTAPVQTSPLIWDIPLDMQICKTDIRHTNFHG